MSIAVFCGLVIFVLLAVMLLAGVPCEYRSEYRTVSLLANILNRLDNIVLGWSRQHEPKHNEYSRN